MTSQCKYFFIFVVSFKNPFDQCTTRPCLTWKIFRPLLWPLIMTSWYHFRGSVTSSNSRSKNFESTCQFSKKLLEPFLRRSKITDCGHFYEIRPPREKIRTCDLTGSKFFSKISFHSIQEKEFLINPWQRLKAKAWRCGRELFFLNRMKWE